jgi:hypothetical protein
MPGVTMQGSHLRPALVRCPSRDQHHHPIAQQRCRCIEFASKRMIDATSATNILSLSYWTQLQAIVSLVRNCLDPGRLTRLAAGRQRLLTAFYEVLPSGGAHTAGATTQLVGFLAIPRGRTRAQGTTRSAPRARAATGQKAFCPVAVSCAY